MKKVTWLPVVLVVLVVLVACGPAQTPSTPPQSSTGETFMLALPRLELNVDSAGNPSMFGINAGALGRFIGTDLSNLKMDPAMVKSMTDNNVQHVEVRQAGDAVVLFVNGKPMPHIGWSDQSLQLMTQVAGAFGVQNAEIYGRLLPLARRLGADVVLRFPKQAGAADIPLASAGGAVPVTPSSAPPSAIAHMEVKYDQNGVPGVMGISADDLRRIGITPPGYLGQETLSALQAADIQNLELRSKNNGLWVYVNGNPLPNVNWDDTLMQNATDLYVQMNPDNPNLPIIKLLGPFLNKADVDVLFHFPIAAGKQPIPAKMHE